MPILTIIIEPSSWHSWAQTQRPTTGKCADRWGEQTDFRETLEYSF